LIERFASKLTLINSNLMKIHHGGRKERGFFRVRNFTTKTQRTQRRTLTQIDRAICKQINTN